MDIHVTVGLRLGAGVRTATWGSRPHTGRLSLAAAFAPPAFLRRLNKLQLVLLSAIGSAIGTVLLLSTRSVPVLCRRGSVIRFCVRGNLSHRGWPSWADRYPRYAATVFGLLFAVGLAGGAVFPWTVGQISQVLLSSMGDGGGHGFGAIIVSTVCGVIRRRTNPLPTSIRT